MEKEKLYIGSKIINARPMDELKFLKDYKGQDVTNRDQESREGYKITYPGGYASWSPKDVFEIAYRELTTAEKKMF